MSNPLTAIEHISKGNEKEKKELLSLFIKETTQRLKALKLQTKKSDWLEVKKTTHAFKSTFLYLSMTTAIELAQAIETTAGEKPKVTKTQINKMNEICLEVIDIFKQELVRLNK